MLPCAIRDEPPPRPPSFVTASRSVRPASIPASSDVANRSDGGSASVPIMTRDGDAAQRSPTVALLAKAGCLRRLLELDRDGPILRGNEVGASLDLDHAIRAHRFDIEVQR